MQTIVLFVSLTTAFVAIGLLGDIGKKHDHYENRKRALLSKVQQINEREELNRPFRERVLKFICEIRNYFLSKIADKTGYKFKRISGLILLFIFLIPAIFMSNSLSMTIMIIALGGVAAILLPNYYLKSKDNKRSKIIREELPDIMDMLTVCVEAGLGLDGAILKIGGKNQNLLTTELVNTIKEIQYGRPRREAYHDLAARNGVAELKTFVAALIQAEKYGLPIKAVLKIQSGKLREARKQAAQVKAMKSPVKIMIPIVIFIFPVIFIILMGPSVINIMGTLF